MSRAVLSELLEGRLGGHPLHPILVHFPTALFPTSLLFDVAGLAGVGEGIVVPAAFFLLALGLAGGIAAALPGLLDWSELARGSPERRTADRHALLNLGVLTLFGVTLALRAGSLDQASPPLGWVVLSAIGVVLLGWANFLGGRLVYQYGVGVRLRTPKGPEVEDKRAG